MLRVLDQISILYATGCLASTWSVFPFSETQVRSAAQLVLEQWLKERGGVEAHEEQEAVETIRGFIQVNQSRFIRRIGDGHWSTPPKPVGYHLQESNLFALFPTVWRSEACSRLDDRQVAEKLVAAGYLRAEMSCGRLSKIARKIMVEDKRQRLVCISEAILGVGGTEHQGDGTIHRFVP